MKNKAISEEIEKYEVIVKNANGEEEECVTFYIEENAIAFADAWANEKGYKVAIRKTSYLIW